MADSADRGAAGATAARRALAAIPAVAAGPAILAAAAFAAVDLAVAAGSGESGGGLAPLCGYALLSSVLLAIAGAGCLAAVSLFSRKTAALGGWRARAARAAAALAAAGPAAFFAGMVTAGQSISASRWRFPVFAAVVACAVGGLLLLVAALQRAPSWSGGRRAAAGGAALVAACAATALTAFHATTYLHIHLGVLLAASVLLQAGLSLLPLPGRGATAGVRIARAGALGAALVAALALSRSGGELRPQIGLTVFSDTLVAQKLAPVLFLLSPVQEPEPAAGGGADPFAGTRLARSNPPPVPPLPPGRYRGHNVVWVSADAFRADALGPREGAPSPTPNLDRLAAQSTAFEEAIVDFSHTSRSVLSLLSGRWDVNFPSERVASRHPGDVADRGRLPRVLRKGGYRTVADMMGGRWGEVFFEKKYLPGFDEHAQPGPTCVEQVAWLREFAAGRGKERPFFLWMHIFDTHTPLQHPAVKEPMKGRPKEEYAAAIRHVDGCVGEAIDALRDAGLWDRTVFVFFADHGEALGEHRRTLKHSTCYLHDVRVPLLFRLPGAPAPRSVRYRFQLSDLLPTTANLLGIPTEGEIVEGDDLSGLLGDRPAPKDRGLAFSKGHPEQYSCAGVLSGPHHLIYTRSGRFYELYDVDRDPGETENLVASGGAVVGRLRPLLDAYYAKFKIRHKSRVLRRPIPERMD